VDKRYVGGDVDMTNPVPMRSGMKGNFHVPFWRAVEGATSSLTLIWNAAINILKLALSTAGHVGTVMLNPNASGDWTSTLIGEILERASRVYERRISVLIGRRVSNVRT
ncbi:MAG: hypothetical protein RIM23_15360, partial [Coleofasciculus sp. G3-WIS-01]